MEYVKTPGYNDDLISLFAVYFNGEEFYSRYKAVAEDYKADADYYKGIIAKMGDVPETLLPLFYQKDGNKCFLAEYFAMESVSRPGKDPMELLDDVRKLTGALLDYYFDDEEGGSERKRGAMKPEEAAAEIDALDETTDVKCGLLRFVSGPAKVVEDLKEQLTEKKQLLDKLYEQASQVMSEVLTLFADNKMKKALYRYFGREISEYKKTQFAICAIDKYSLSAVFHDSKALFYIGTDSAMNLAADEDNTLRKPVEIVMLGKILSDETRVKLLELLKANGELYTGQIAGMLEMNLTAVFYHLNMMYEADMLSTRNEGRKVFYKIKSDYFVAAKQLLGNYII